MSGRNLKFTQVNLHSYKIFTLQSKVRKTIGKCAVSANVYVVHVQYSLEHKYPFLQTQISLDSIRHRCDPLRGGSKIIHPHS